MSNNTQHTVGLFPSINDAASVAVLVVVYWMRLAAPVTEGVTLPFYTYIVTDAILPLLAAGWIWVAAMATLYARLYAPHPDV